MVEQRFCKPSVVGSTPTTGSRRRAARYGGQARFRNWEEFRLAGQPFKQGKGTVTSFHYVYILQSLSKPDQVYTGRTEDLKRRLAEHNAGRVPHTSKFVPWEIRAATAFKDLEKAVAFEYYLKSGSGRAFLRRHF